MERGVFLSALGTLISLFTFTDCFDQIYFISGSVGDDGNTCTLESPCKTLACGYEKAMNKSGISRLTLALMGSYVMRNSFMVKTFNPYLEILTVSNYKDAEVVGSVNASIIVGCKDLPNCIGYNISIKDLVFRNFSRDNVIAAYSVPRIAISNCTFIHNNGTLLEGYDTSFELYRFHVTGEGCLRSPLSNEAHCNSKPSCSGSKVRLVFEAGHNKHVDIRRSKFLHNCASTSDGSNCGGALCLVFTKRSSNNTVTIFASHFQGNLAKFGGGLSISVLGQATGNTFTVVSTEFSNNYALQSGGGFFYEASEGSSKNSISFFGNTFQENIAKSSGGAGKLIFHNIENDMVRHRFSVTHFIRNKAEMQAGIGLVRTHRASSLAQRMLVEFEGTIFSANSYLPNTSFSHSGTLCAFNVNIQFTGNNYFIYNVINSPLYACGSNVNVSGNLLFDGNWAHYAGGGMSLVDGSKLIMMPGAHIRFSRNYAAVKGGAIYYESSLLDNEILPYNPMCFLQYGESSVAARDWNVSKLSKYSGTLRYDFNSLCNHRRMSKRRISKAILPF